MALVQPGQTPDFRSQRQDPFAAILNAYQQKAQMEQQNKLQEESLKQQKFQNLMNAVQTGMNVSQQASKMATERQTKNAMNDLSILLSRRGMQPSSPMTAPMQQFQRAQGPMSAQGMGPAPVPGQMVQPTLGQAQGFSPVTQPQLQSAVVKAGLGGQQVADEAFPPQLKPLNPLDAQQKQLELQKTQAEINKIKKESTGGLSSETASKIAGNLRQDFMAQTKQFGDTGQAYRRVLDTAKDASAAGDVGLIFSYMRMLDPASTVREGEFATAENTGSIPDRIWKSYNKAMEGERLAPPQRQDFVSRAKYIYEGQEKGHKVKEREFRRMAGRAQVDPEQSVFNMRPDLADESEVFKQMKTTDTLVKGGSFNGKKIINIRRIQ